MQRPGSGTRRTSTRRSRSTGSGSSPRTASTAASATSACTSRTVRPFDSDVVTAACLALSHALSPVPLRPLPEEHPRALHQSRSGAAKCRGQTRPLRNLVRVLCLYMHMRPHYGHSSNSNSVDAAEGTMLCWSARSNWTATGSL